MSANAGEAVDELRELARLLGRMDAAAAAAPWVGDGELDRLAAAARTEVAAAPAWPS